MGKRSREVFVGIARIARIRRDGFFWPAILAILAVGAPSWGQSAASAGDEVELAPSDIVRWKTGAPTIEIPAPPGAGGFKPELVVRYRGDAQDGIFGVGWSLNLSEIRRSERFGTPTFDDSEDTFELDGQPLVFSSATGRYHPFVESFDHVRPILSEEYSSIIGWEVERSDGSVARYGGSWDTFEVGSLGVTSWWLSRLTDANGNQIRFEYNNVTGTPRLDRVRYTFRGGSSTQGPERRVEFIYEARPDPVTQYASGSERTLDERVREVQVRVGGEIQRRLVFNYAASGYATIRSRLERYQEFGDDCTGPSTSGCVGLPPTTYVYSDPSDSILSGVGTQWESGSIQPPGPFEKQKANGSSKDLGWRSGDVDGDGILDLVRAYEVAAGASGILEVWRGTGTGFVLDSFWSSKLAEAQFLNPRVHVVGASTSITDVVIDAFVPSPMYFASQRDWHDPISGAGNHRYLMPVNAQLVDVDGDGRADLVASFIAGAALINQSCTSLPGLHVRHVFLNTGSGWAWNAALSGGDSTNGLPPFQSYLVLGGNVSCEGDKLHFIYGKLPLGAGSIVPILGGAHLADLNGDRKLDVVASQGEGSQISIPPAARLSWGAWIQQPTGFAAAPQFTPPVAHTTVYAFSIARAFVDAGIRYSDMNGDGKQDLVHAPSSGGGVWLSTGAGWSQDDSYLPPVSFVNSGDQPKQVFLLDVNGDGLMDVIRADGGSGGRRAWLQSRGTTGRWIEDDRFRPPASVAVASSPLTDDPERPYRTRGVMLGDFDGNGTLDFLRSYENGSQVNTASMASVSAFPDRLSEVANGRGGYAQYSYVSLVRQRDPTLEARAIFHAIGSGEGLETDPDARLGYASLPVVSSVTIGGIGTGPFVTKYRYAHPRWDSRRVLPLGIRLVEEERDDGSIVETFVSQRHGAVGQIQFRLTRDVSGDLKREGAAWEVRDGSEVEGSASGIFVGRIAESWSENAYGTAQSGPRRSVFYEYDDSYGYNFVERVTETRATGALLIERLPAPAGSSRGMIGLVKKLTQSSSGVIYSEKTFDYASSRPLVTKRTSRVQPRVGGAPVFAEEIWQHDAHGNVTSYRDAEGRTTSIYWDGDGGPCPAQGASYALQVGIRDPKGEVSCLLRDATTGKVTQATAYNGDITITLLDPFGEVSATLRQPFSESAPILLETRVHERGVTNPAGQPFTETKRFVGDGTWVRKATYEDGLGHPVRSVSDGPFAGEWIGVVREYDYAGRPTAETYPGSCSNEHCTSVTGAGVVETLFDALGRVVERTQPGGRRDRYHYRRVVRAQPAGSGNGEVFDGVLAMDPKGNLTQELRDDERLVWVDECDNAISPGAPLDGVVCAALGRTFYTYEPTGELAGIFDAVANAPGPEGGYANPKHRTLFGYDTLGRRLTVEDRNAGVQVFGYDLVGNVTLRINARNQATSYVFDELNRVTQINRPTGEKSLTVFYDDDASGGDWTRKRASVVEHGGYSATYRYDAFGRLASQTQVVDAIALRADYEYDLLGRTTRILYPEQHTRLLYQYAGPYLRKVCNQIVGGSGCAPGESEFVQDIQYDSFGRAASWTLPAGTVSYTYEAVERRLEKVRFVSNGGIEQLELGYGYDAASNISEIIDGRDDKSDGVDAGGLFFYDTRNRLAAYDPGGPTSAPPARYFTYDVLGNLVGRDLSAPASPPNQLYADPDKAHALTSIEGAGASFEYDEDGNLERLPTTGYYHTADSQNRLVCVGATPGGCEKLRVGYDIDGKRIVAEMDGEKIIRLGEIFELNVTTDTVSSFVIADGRAIVERRRSPAHLRAANDPPWAFEIVAPPWLGPAAAVLAAAGLVAFGFRARVHEQLVASPARGGLALTLCLTIVAPYPVSAGPPASDWWTNRWLISDHLGSVVAVVAPGGEVVRRRSFEPFGEVLKEDGTEEARIIFAGHEYAEAAQVYDFKARWYVPQAGRFASVDPAMSLADPQQQNGYSYARNNPINRVDPTGMFSIAMIGVNFALSFPTVRMCNDGAVCIGWGRPPTPPPVDVPVVPPSMLLTPPIPVLSQIGQTTQPALERLERGVMLYGSFVILDAGFALLETLPGAIVGAWVIGGGGAVSAVAVGILVVGGGVLAGGMIAVGVENLVHVTSGGTPISDATGVPIPIFTPSP